MEDGYGRHYSFCESHKHLSSVKLSCLQAGLYSASLVAFFVETSKQLKVDTSVVLLSQILERLGGDAHSVTLANLQPTSSDILINISWCISLVFSLSAVLAATVVQRWVREYASVFYRYHTPLERARTCQYLFDGMIRWRLLSVVNAIPTLIHISLFLFLLGLCSYLINLNTVVGFVTTVAAAICTAFYLFASFVPCFYPQSPYQTPLTDVFVRLQGILTRRRHHRWFVLPSLLDHRRDLCMQGQDREGRLERDARALAWTIANITDDDGFEEFVASVPGSLESAWGAEVWKFKSMESGVNQYSFKVVDMSYTTPQSEACGRIKDLLRTCIDPGLNSDKRTHRARVCTNAILSLTLVLNDIEWFPDLKLLGHGLTYLARATNYNQEVYTVQGLHHHTTSAVKWVCLMLITLRRILADGEITRAASKSLQSDNNRGDAINELTSIIMHRTSGFLTFVPGLTTVEPNFSTQSDQATSSHHEWLITHLRNANSHDLTWRCRDIREGGVLFTFDVFLTCYTVPGLISDESWQLLEETLSMIARSWSGDSSMESRSYLIHLLRHVLTLIPSPSSFIVSPFMILVEALFSNIHSVISSEHQELLSVLDDYERRSRKCRETISKVRERIQHAPPSSRSVSNTTAVEKSIHK